ncbi:MAG: selenocysteine-specific translation elongation factor [Planctomycetota bacterium]
MLITKTDLVDETTLEVVRQEIIDEVKGTFLENKPIIPISSATGEGFDVLRAEILRLCDKLEERAAFGVFRYPIQRVFTQTGFGTVFTGVPFSGRARIGDVIEVVPGNERGKIRKLQAYHEDVEEVFAGHCAALNVSDLKRNDMERGMVVSSPGFTRSASNIEVELTYLPLDKDRPLKDYSEVTFHCGAAEVPAHVALLAGRKQVAPRETVFAQIRLAHPIAAWTGLRFVIRRMSPAETIGGGTILSMTDKRLRRGSEAVLAHFERRAAAIGDPAKLLRLVIEEGEGEPVGISDLCIETGLFPDEVREILKGREFDGLIEAGKDWFLFESSLAPWRERLKKEMDSLHEKLPFATWHEKAAIRSAGPKNDRAFELALQGMVDNGIFDLHQGRYRRHGYKPPLGSEDLKLAERLLAWMAETPFDSHSQNIVVSEWNLPPDTVRRVYRVLCESGEVVALPDGVFISRAAYAEAEAKLRKHFESNSTLASGHFKSIIGAARKVAIALLDHFEKTGVTYRKGNEHQLRRY